jgi:hypothetical protein
MFFTKTHKYTTKISKEDLRERLVGKHLTIHNLDFEVQDKGEYLKIIPHAEEIQEIKTLPETYVDFAIENGMTRVQIKCRMRKFDSGGPFILLIFCFFMIACSVVMFFTTPERSLTYTLLAIGLGVLTIFWVRLEMGYFDYVRKIFGFLKNHLGH